MDDEPHMATTTEKGATESVSIKTRDARAQLDTTGRMGAKSGDRQDKGSEKVTITASTDSLLAEIKPTTEARRASKLGGDGLATKGDKELTEP